MKPIVTGSLIALTAVSLTTNCLMYLRYSTSRPLVTVGNQVISKKDYQDALDYQTQGAVLKKLVLSDLINQAATAQGVEPSDSDVNTRIQEIERSDPGPLNNVSGNPTAMAEFTQDLKTQMALDNLRVHGQTVTDSEVAAYYAANKQQFALPVQVQTDMVVADNSVDADSAATLLRQGIGKDVIARQPGMHVVGIDGYSVNLQQLPQAYNQKLSSAVFKMKPGDVRVIPMGPEFMVVKADQYSQAQIPPLSAIRPEVVHAALLAKAVPVNVEIANLYQQTRPQFTVAKYAAYFDNISGVDSDDVASSQ